MFHIDNDKKFKINKMLIRVEIKKNRLLTNNKYKIDISFLYFK